MRKTQFKKRSVSYWLICMGRLHQGHKGGGIIKPSEAHWHRAHPYAVRCNECRQKDGLS